MRSTSDTHFCYMVTDDVDIVEVPLTHNPYDSWSSTNVGAGAAVGLGTAIGIAMPLGSGKALYGKQMGHCI